MGPATTAGRKVVSPSTLIGPFEFERALTTPVVQIFERLRIFFNFWTSRAPPDAVQEFRMISRMTNH